MPGEHGVCRAAWGGVGAFCGGGGVFGLCKQCVDELCLDPEGEFAEGEDLEEGGGWEFVAESSLVD